MPRIGCKYCGTYDKHEPCEKCGVPIHIGHDYRCPHEKALPTKGFEPYFDMGLGIQVNGPGDRHKAMRPRWEDDHVIHLQERR
jgi:hypothetical protein